jgi:hypothetical protein
LQGPQKNIGGEMSQNINLKKSPLISKFEKQISDISFNNEKIQTKEFKQTIPIIESSKQTKSDNSGPLIALFVMSMFTIIVSACLLVPGA